MNYEHTFNSNAGSKIVLDYSFCNSSDIWNYIGIVTIILFSIVLISYLKHLKSRKGTYNCVYLVVLITLGLLFVVPCMCWLLTLVEILVTFIRYGQIAASPLPMLSLPIRALAFIYMKFISAVHRYLTAPGTFIFLLFFAILTCIRYVIVIIIQFRLPAFFIFSWIGLAIPLYALIEVGNIDSWTDLAFNTQLPLYIVFKFFALLLAMNSLIIWILLFLLFLIGYSIKFGLTMLFICKCLLIIVLVRFTYVIGKAFVLLVFFKPTITNTNRSSDDSQ